MWRRLIARFEPKYTRYNDLRYLRHLYAVNAACGYFPFYDFDECKLIAGFYTTKLHPLVTVIVRTIGSIVMMILEYRRLADANRRINFIPEALYVMQSVVVVLINVVPTLELAYYKRKTIDELVRNFRHVDALMLELNGTDDRRRRDTYHAEIVAFQLLFTVILVADVCHKINDSSASFANTLIGGLTFVAVQLFLYLLCNFALALRSRFRTLNRAIVDLRNHPRGAASTVPRSIRVHRFYEILVDLTHQYNRLFGWSILMYVAAMFISFLQCFTTLLMMNDKMDGDALENMTAVVILLITGMIVIVCGDLTNKEIEWTKHTSLKMFSRLPSKTVTSKYVGYIAFQVSLERPQLSAAGLFPLTLATLLTLIGSLASYVVIILQFYK